MATTPPFSCKYSLSSRIKPYPENPRLTLKKLNARYKEVHDTWHSVFKDTLRKVIHGVESDEREDANNSDPVHNTWHNVFKDTLRKVIHGVESDEREECYSSQSHANNSDPVHKGGEAQLSIDAMFCLGLGSLSHDTLYENSSFRRPPKADAYIQWSSMTQLVIFEALREVLGEGYQVGPSYVQDPVFNKLDQRFLAERGFAVTRNAESLLTSKSAMFCTNLDKHIAWGYIADYQPQILLASPGFQECEEHGRDYEKLQLYQKTHSMRHVLQDEALNDYELWVRNA